MKGGLYGMTENGMGQRVLNNCTVTKVVYRNKITDYAVIEILCQDGVRHATGCIPDVCEGEKFDLYGEYVTKSKYGLTFEVSSYISKMPEGEAHILAYLAAGAVKGVGKKTAELIVEQFGTKSLYVIEHEPDKLTLVHGIGKIRAKMISDAYRDSRTIRTVVAFLNPYGIKVNVAKTLFDRYGDRAIEVLKENPYQLTKDVYGIGFKKADTIAKAMGIEMDSPLRLTSGILYVIRELEDNNGDSCAFLDSLVSDAVALLTVDREVIDRHLDTMKMNRDIVFDTDDEGNTIVFRSIMFFAERAIARRTLAIALRETPSVSNVAIVAEDVEQELGIQYDDVQRHAIQTAIESKFTVVTGGPGTGKTTIIMAVITALKKAGEFIRLAAPTGRAAKRMAEVTGCPAQTIHKMLEFTPGDGFARNEENTLEGDTLIVDEASMIDTRLMGSLLRAVPDAMRVIIVGDIDQLPSVGPGKVMHDLIDADVVPVVRLKRIYRQGQESLIIKNAHSINEGAMPDLSNNCKGDFFFIPELSESHAASQISDLVARRLPSWGGYKPADIQVLAPMKKGVVGVNDINIMLQKRLNPVRRAFDRLGRLRPISINVDGTEFRPGDKIMVTRNNYELDVYNGDVGFVTNVDVDDQSLDADFDGRSVHFEKTNLLNITLAYACTIHKSQGSEYKAVVVPIFKSQSIMLQRNLLYTAVTRAKEVCVLVGNRGAIQIAVSKTQAKERVTKLKSRLIEVFNSVYS